MNIYDQNILYDSESNRKRQEETFRKMAETERKNNILKYMQFCITRELAEKMCNWEFQDLVKLIRDYENAIKLFNIDEASKILEEIKEYVNKINDITTGKDVDNILWKK